VEAAAGARYGGRARAEARDAAGSGGRRGTRMGLRVRGYTSEAIRQSMGSGRRAAPARVRRD